MKPYYDHAGITIYHGDCLEIAPALEANAIITDPPYGIGIKYGPSYDDSREAYWDWFIPAIAALSARFKPTIFTHRVTALGKLSGWDWVGVWNKPGCFGARIGKSCLLPHWEPIFFYGIHRMGTHTEYLPDVLTYNPNSENHGNVAGAIGRQKWQSLDFQYHPCPKPEGLYRDLVGAFTSASDVVLDPFAGTGTTLVAAKNLGRRAIGIEIEEKYCEIAAKRLGQEVFEFGTVTNGEEGQFHG